MGICISGSVGLIGLISKGVGDPEGDVVERTVARSPPSRKPSKKLECDLSECMGTRTIRALHHGPGDIDNVAPNSNSMSTDNF